MAAISFTSPTLKASTSKPSLSCPLSLKQARPMTVSCRAWSSPSTCESGGGSTTNYYDLLSLNPGAVTTGDEVKKAYRALALRYHPDVCRDPSEKQESTRMFVLLREAYQTLSDPDLRREYDYELGLRGERLSSTSRDAVEREAMRRRWQDQVAELKRRSSQRAAQKSGSWGSGRRAHNLRRD